MNASSGHTVPNWQPLSPEQRRVALIQGLEREIALPGAHPGLVEAHQAFKLPVGDAGRPLGGEGRRPRGTQWGQPCQMPSITWDPRAPVLLFSQGQDSWFRKLLALPRLGDTVGQGLGSRDQPPSLAQPLPRYPLADEQAVGVLDGSSLV